MTGKTTQELGFDFLGLGGGAYACQVCFCLTTQPGLHRGYCKLPRARASALEVKGGNDQ